MAARTPGALGIGSEKEGAQGVQLQHSRVTDPAHQYPQHTNIKEEI